MTAVVILVVAALALIVLLLFGATIELHRQILQLRQYVGFVDETRSISINSDVAPDDLPLPALTDLANDERAVVLVLSNGCTTCNDIAANLDMSGMPQRLAVLIEAGTAADAAYWLEAHELTFSRQMVYDDFGLIAQRVGVSVTPAAIKIEGGIILGAITVPSARQLDHVLQWLERVPQGKPATPGVE